MTDKYKDLRDALDAGPTPGPWYSGADSCQNNEKALAICKENIDAHTAPSSGYFYVIFLPDGRRVALVGHGPDGRANAEYIKSAQPETIRSLLAERDALREALRPLAEIDLTEPPPIDFAWFVLLARAALAQEQGGSDANGNR